MTDVAIEQLSLWTSIPERMCKNGLHPWVPENLVQAKQGWTCRLCKSIANRRWREEHRDAYRAQRAEYFQRVKHDPDRRERQRQSERRRRAAMSDEERALDLKKKRAYREANADRIREYMAAYYADPLNALRHKQMKAEWRRRNPTYFADYGRRYYAEHRDRVLERTRRWASENRFRKALASHNRRARKEAAAGAASYDQIVARMEFFGGICVYCGDPLEEIDHSIPISRGGANWAANQRPTCRSCNRRKWTKTPSEYLAHLDNPRTLLLCRADWARI